MSMDRKRSRLLVILAGLATVLAPGLGLAEDGFNFQVESLDMGALFTDPDTSSSKFEEYRDMDSDAVLNRLHFLGMSEDADGWLDFLGTNVRRADARYTLRYGHAGDFTLLVDYNRIPHRFMNDGVILHTQTSLGVYEIADPVQASLQAANEAQFALSSSGVNFAFLNANLAPHIAAADLMDLGLDRRRTQARLDIGKLGPWAWGFEVKHERRSGNRPYGASFGFSNVIELPEPIHYDTTAIDVSTEWTGNRGGLRLGYTYSMFENELLAIRYDNPWRVSDTTDGRAYVAPGSGSVNGAASGQNALAPDNTAQNFYAAGRGKLGDQGWVRGSFSYTRMKQDDRLLPYSTNSAINASAGAPFDVTEEGNLPVSNADTEVGVTNLALGAGSKLGDRGDVEFHYRLYDYDNKSARVEFPGYVRFDSVWEEIGRITVPYAYKRQSLGGEIGYQVARASRLAFGYERDQWDRDYREVSGAHEDAIKVSFDTRAVNKMAFRGSYSHGKRSIDEYLVEAQLLSFTHDEDVNNLPSLRKYDEAERDFDAFYLFAQFMPTDKVDVSASFRNRNDDYAESEHGLLTEDLWHLHFELGITPRDDVSFYLYGGRENHESFQRARQSGATISTDPAADWELTLTEDTDVWGGGLTAKLNKRWLADARFQWNRADGTSDFFSPPGGTPDDAIGFDEYDDNEFWTADLGLRYKIGPHTTAGFRYAREDYMADRFQRQGLAVYNPGALILNGDDGDYVADIYMFSLNFHF